MSRASGNTCASSRSPARRSERRRGHATAGQDHRDHRRRVHHRRRVLTIEVTGGVDTHQDTPAAAVIDQVGRVLGTEQFPADAAGYTALLDWMRRFGPLGPVGVEGTGAYGAGLARLLRDQGVHVVEVDRPDRKTRRFQGKSDPIDAVQAARTAPAAERTGTPKQRDGRVEALRNLRAARRRPTPRPRPPPSRSRYGHRPTAINSSPPRSTTCTLLEPLVTAIKPGLVAANGVGTDAPAGYWSPPAVTTTDSPGKPRSPCSAAPPRRS
ncbi:IS110 family transposase [Actinomadura physcomitrii]|uniref:IS110 family transposase n=1 Tax=Actinomadura physcomitrii TaxID=2650748 RepID=UPI002E26F709